MDITSEQLLIDLVVDRNDQQAFAQLVRAHQSKIRNSLRQLTNWNEALADDLAQETFIQAYSKLHQFNGKSKFSSWLYRIAYNQFLQFCRKGQSLKHHAEYEDFESQHLMSDSVGPGESSSVDQLQRQLATVLSEFEPERRTVLHLLLHQQNTQQEIAEITGIPLGTVKTHIKRGRVVLQNKLAHWQERSL